MRTFGLLQVVGPCAHGTIRFITLRYSGIIATFPSLFFTAIQSSHCKLAVGLSQTGAVLVVASSGVIFVYRLSAIWNGNQIVFATVMFFYACMVGSWVGIRILGWTA